MNGSVENSTLYIITGVVGGVLLLVAISIAIIVIFTYYSCKCRLPLVSRNEEGTSDQTVLYQQDTPLQSNTSTLEKEYTIGKDDCVHQMPGQPAARSEEVLLNIENNKFHNGTNVNTLTAYKQHSLDNQHQQQPQHNSNRCVDTESVAPSIISIGSCFTLDSQNSSVFAIPPKFRSDSLNNILEDEQSILSFKTRNFPHFKNSSSLISSPTLDDNEPTMNGYYAQYDDVFVVN